jgi:hypothetical protein
MLAWDLFGRLAGGSQAIDYSKPHVGREISTVDFTGPTAERRRADLVIHWKPSDLAPAHVEVKIWDANLAKTWTTARLIRQKHGTGSDFLLIPIESVGAWEATPRGEAGFDIRHLTWEAVAIGLRRSIAGGNETLRWSAWALGFCGAVEQLILGHPRPTERASRQAIRSMTHVLMEGGRP